MDSPETHTATDLYSTAHILLPDSKGENPEYVRALVEMIHYLTGDEVEHVETTLKNWIPVDEN
jgi:hypothetical protein